MAEQKMGYWIETSNYLTTAYGTIDYIQCDNCRSEVLDDSDIEMDYCPVCGQKKWAERKGKEEWQSE